MGDPLITRRRMLKVALTGSAAMLPPVSEALSAASGANHPNVLMIIADDMNDYGFHGTLPGIKMPYLRKFQQAAVTFDRAYCAAPACMPARAAVFSGLYPHNTGSYFNDSDPWRKAPFTGIEAMPECFQRHGYTTFGRGKLFHSEPPAVSPTLCGQAGCTAGHLWHRDPKRDMSRLGPDPSRGRLGYMGGPAGGSLIVSSDLDGRRWT